MEDSDDSLETIVSSPPLNPVIINESDSSDSSLLKEQDSILTNYNFPHDTLPTVIEESAQEVTFSEYIEARQKMFGNQNCTSSPESDSDEIVTLMPKFNPPSREHIVNTMESYGIPKCKNIMPFFSNEDDAVALPQNPQNNPLHRARGIGLASTPQFQSQLEDITGLEDWRKMKVKELGFNCDGITSSDLRQKLAGDEWVTIEPLIKPPSVKSVQSWVKAWKKHEEENKVIPESQCSHSSKPVSQKSVSQKSEESDISAVFNGLDNISDASKHLGISCGQIEFSSRASTGNVPHEKLGNAKAFTRVSFNNFINFYKFFLLVYI